MTVVKGYFCGQMFAEVPPLDQLPAAAAEEIVLDAALNSKVGGWVRAPALEVSARHRTQAQGGVIWVGVNRARGRQQHPGALGHKAQPVLATPAQHFLPAVRALFAGPDYA